MQLTPVAYKGAADHIHGADPQRCPARLGRRDGHVEEQLPAGESGYWLRCRTIDSPNYPTCHRSWRQAIRGFIPRVWTGLVAPAATPPEIIDRINADVNPHPRARPEAIHVLQDTLGNDPAPLPDGVFATEVDKERRFWSRTFKELGIEPQ